MFRRLNLLISMPVALWHHKHAFINKDNSVMQLIRQVAIADSVAIAFRVWSAKAGVLTAKI